MASPHLLLAALNLLGLSVGAWRLWAGIGAPDVLAINIVWTLYNLVLLGAVVAVAWEKRQLRFSPRVEVQLPAMVQCKGGETIRCRIGDLSRGGAGVEWTSPCQFSPGTKLWLSVLGEAERPLPARVVHQASSRLHLEFGELSLEQESKLMRALFARADAWHDWRVEKKGDQSSVNAFFQLFRLGTSAWSRLLRPARVPALEAPPEIEPGKGLA